MQSRYDIEALKANMKRCDDNIALFNEAIQKELVQKAELLVLIREIEESPE